jgi:thioredoxin-like negative regulator of GroEL
LAATIPLRLTLLLLLPACLLLQVAPTFHLYKGGQKVADMTGAKVDKLRELITKHISTDDGQQN